MDNKDILSRTIKETTLGTNSDYYKYVFKKTEKIICAVFYVVRSNKDINPEDPIIRTVEDTAERLNRVSFSALRTPERESEWASKELGYMLMELESSLRIAHAGRVLGTDVLQVFATEIESVLRALKEYSVPKVQNPFFNLGLNGLEREKVRLRAKAPTEGSDLNLLGAERVGLGNREGRAERVMAVLRDKGQASIKDISEVVTDCSEKTIQRELNALIKDNKIHREGERRWSKYSVV